jgi:hypothetical protein
MRTKLCLWILPCLAIGPVAFGGIGETRLHHPSPFPNDWHGKALDVSGSTAVIGDAYDDTNGTDAGAVYVYEKTGSLWTFQSLVIAPDGASGDQFGHKVAIDGDTLVISAWLDRTVVGLRSGSTYVFVRDGSGWAFQAKLRPSDHEPNDRFGLVLALHGDMLAVGSGHDLNDAPRNYVFKRTGTLWAEEFDVTAGSGWFDERTLAIWDDTLVIGREGSYARVYQRTGGAWAMEIQLDHGDPPWVHNGWAGSLVIEDDLIIVLDRPDEVLIFEHVGGAWTQTGEIENLPGEIAGVVDVSEGRLLVSYWGSGGPRVTRVYEQSGTNWSEVASLLPADQTSSFGHEVAFSGDEVLVGSRVYNAPGEVYAFTLGTQLSALCDASDGSLSLCPCGNPGSPDTGCDINQGTGGVRLDITGMTIGPPNSATAVGTGYPPTATPGATLVRSSNLHASGTVVFGDGVFCLASPVVRVGGAIAINGQTTHVFGHGAMAGTGTFYYQLHYRNTPAMFCAPEAFNLSSGRSITW